MHIHAFNAGLLIGWLLVLAGGLVLSPGLGLAVSGLLLIVLVLLSAKIAGGLYVPEPKRQEGRA
jgi:hypothetical protein